MLLEDTPAVLSFRKLCEDHGYDYHLASGRKPHLIKKGRNINCKTANYVPSLSLVYRQVHQLHLHLPLLHLHRRKAWLSWCIQHQQEVRIWLMKCRETCLTDQQKPKNQTKMTTTRKYKEILSHDLPEWLQQFRHRLVGESVPEHRDVSSSSHELPSEPRAKVVSGKHSIFTPCPKDRNCDICSGTKIRRASCRKRTHRSHNYRYAVVIQDVTPQWIQSYPCKTKTFSGNAKEFAQVLGADVEPIVVYTANSLEFGKSWADLSWNRSTSTPHRSETDGIAVRPVCRMISAES